MFIDKQAPSAGKSQIGLTSELRQLMVLRQVPKKDWGLPSGRAIAFAHSLIVPAGKHVGKPLRLAKPQIEFIRDVYNPRDKDGQRKRRQAVFSVARRNGKTLLAAVIILLHLVGPFKKPNSVIASAATTRKQASIVYRFVARMVKMNVVHAKRLKVVDSTKHVTHRRDGSFYSAIAAEAGGQFGEGLDLVVYDELSQAKNALLYDVLMTSLGAQVEPLMMIISTQAPADDHILSELIDYGLKIRAGEIEDDTFTVHLYAAEPGCKLLDEREWKKANPALGDYRDIGEFRAAMKRAEKVPSLENRLRNLYLNQRVQAKAPFLSPNVWVRGSKPTVEDLLYDGRPVYGGLDLSARTDLSAFVMAVEDDESNIHLVPRIWTPGDTLDERGLRDRAPYRVWADKGFLIPVPGQVLDYDFLAADVGELSSTIPFANVNYDMWRIDVLKQSFARLGVDVPLSPFGQGYKSMSPAIEAFEELAVQGKLFHGGHPVLRWCISNAVIDSDAAGNRKLTKAKSFGRIDASVAAVMAVAACRLRTEAELDMANLVA
ncbi:terminase large subunit [Sinorhizobium medicae]|uniref:terminase large subunit n=1 Tax=Sinorhizobium medicae TaxID=110321 RepID=UPI000FD8D535|nr:terminase TerL endonuclease subunit [Sinorhizobium medicae]RVJ30872.1 terminase [Sinorhizobium medicae]